MKLRFGIFFLFLASCIASFAQTTATLTGTVTDSDAQVWFGATATVNLQNPYGTKPVVCSTGAAVPVQVVYVLTGGGAFTGTIIRNDAICPAGTTWTITIHPQSSAPTQIMPTQNITTSTYNAGAFVSAHITAPRFDAGIFGAYGYNTTEPQPNPCVIYNTFFDVTTLQQLTCDGTSFIPVGLMLSTNGVANGNQGHLNFLDSATVTWHNSGADETATAIGGGGNPVTSKYIHITYSGWYDDNHSLSTAVPVATVICDNVATCTVNTSSAHGLVAGDYVDAHTITGWPFSGTQEPFRGSFQVIATGLTSTQFEFNFVSAFTCSSSCGNIYDANYWAIYQTANAPFIKNHGTVYGYEYTAADADANFVANVAPLCASGVGPNYVIIDTGQGDLSGGAVATTIEQHILNVAADAHTAGCKVILGSIVAANYGGSADNSIWANAGVFNEWAPQAYQSFTNVASGQYIDQYCDYNSYLASRNVHLGDDAAASQIVGQRTNECILTKAGNAPGQWPLVFQWNSGLGIDTSNFYGQSAFGFFDLSDNSHNPCASGSEHGCNPVMYIQGPHVVMQNLTGDSNPLLQLYNNQQSEYAEWVWGYDSGGFNRGFGAFHRFGDHDHTNWAGFSIDGATGYPIRFNGNGELFFDRVDNGVATPIGVDASGKVVPVSVAAAPAFTSGTNGFYEAFSCTVGGVSHTCYDEDVDTGALNNNTTTTVTLPFALPTAVLSIVCSDNSARVQTGNDQPVGANVIGQIAPYTSFSANTPATGMNAYCRVRGY